MSSQEGKGQDQTDKDKDADVSSIAQSQLAELSAGQRKKKSGATGGAGKIAKKKKPAVQDKHIKDLAKKKKDLEQQLLITKQQTKLAKITGGQVKAGKKIAAPVPGSDDAPPPEEQKHKLSDKIHHVTVGRLVIYCIIFHSLLSCC